MMFTPSFPSEYVQGYTAALQDVIREMHNFEYDAKRCHLKHNYKTYKALLDCMLENRTILRENPDAFIRWNDSKNDFEIWFDGKRE